jgi:carbon-monoxide dehydrogenase medium subunit
MKLPAFDYIRPRTLEEAASILASSGGEARLLAGGQSLLPVMAFRLAAPRTLVDLGAIESLKSISVDSAGVRLGAMVRWRDILDSRELSDALPLLPAAIDHVAHYQIRNRGTVGGSLAHADPAAEFPGIAVLHDAVIEVINATGRREIAAGDLFLGALETSLGADDIITGIRFPKWKASYRWGFEEFSRRRGDFALAAIGIFYDLSADATVADAHIAVVGATDRPRRLAEAEAVLNGKMLDEASIARAAAVAAEVVDPPGDLHGSAEYRRSLVATLIKRAFRQAQMRGHQ